MGTVRVGSGGVGGDKGVRLGLGVWVCVGWRGCRLSPPVRGLRSLSALSDLRARLFVLITFPVTRTGRIAIIRRRARTLSTHKHTPDLLDDKEEEEETLLLCSTCARKVNHQSVTEGLPSANQPASQPSSQPPPSQTASHYTLPAFTAASQSSHVCTSER